MQEDAIVALRREWSSLGPKIVRHESNVSMSLRRRGKGQDELPESEAERWKEMKKT